MIGDIVIVALAIASGLTAYRLFTVKTESRATAVCFGLVLISSLIGGIVVPNLGLISGLLTPEINGLLIDAETMKPVPGIDVLVGWSCHYYEFPYHSGQNHVKTIHVTSDSDGHFYAPSRYKSLALKLPVLYFRENSNSHISIFSLDYEVINSRSSDKINTLVLKRITDYDRLTKKYQDIEWSERYGSKEEKALASVYKAQFDQKRKEFISKYGIPKDGLDRIYGR